jgi:hypothetical protein
VLWFPYSDLIHVGFSLSFKVQLIQAHAYAKS